MKLLFIAAQCLYVISEDNKLLADLIITVYPWFMEASLKKGQAIHPTVKIYSVGKSRQIHV